MTFFTKRKQLFILVVVMVVFFLIGQSIVTNRKNEMLFEKSDNMENDFLNIEFDNSKANDDEIFVHIYGSVEKAGVYQMNVGDRICDVVEKAGGFKYNADKNALNLSEVVVDEQKIEIPAIDYGLENNSKISENAVNNDIINSGDGKININSADSKSLETLPGVGEKKAVLIIEYRKTHKFKSKEELKKIKGIGEKTFQKIESLIKI